MSVFNKLFSSGYWQVCLINYNKNIFIKPVKGFWYADPFLFKNGNDKYVFVEAFDIKKEVGTLGYLSENESFNKLHQIVSTNTHYSFPNVFSLDGSFYMIPESGERNGIYLYRFDSFPNKLSVVKKICDGNFVDTAIVSLNSNSGAFLTYNADNKELYKLEIDFNSFDFNLELICADTDKNLRPAGNAFFENGKLLFPFQNSKEKYGKSIQIREVSLVDGEIKIGEIASEINGNILPSLKVDRIHTLNHLSDEIVVDFMIKKISLLKPFKMLKRKIRRRHSKKIYG